jgi:hypothetical protein
MQLDNQEYKELLNNWLQAQQKRQEFWDQFITWTVNGKITKQGTRNLQSGDLEIGHQLDEDEKAKQTAFYDYLKKNLI